MRIISGKYKNKKIFRNIKNISPLLKPTTSKIKEAVFNIINSYFMKNNFLVEKSSFIDLCCGTGSIGIEALSRGFNKVYFLDINNESLDLTRHNLCNLNCINPNWDVIKSSFCDLQILGDITSDLIYLDPPYELSITAKILEVIKKFLHANSLFIIETSKKITPSNLVNYEVISIKKYGRSAITILRLKSSL